jgi:hypothetical protein
MTQMPNRQLRPIPTSSSTCATCPIRQQHQHATPGTKLRPQRKLDIATETTIICHYCQHASSLQLAKEHGVTGLTITSILRTYGIHPRTLAQAQHTRRHSPTLHFLLSTQVSTLERLLANPTRLI